MPDPTPPAGHACGNCEGIDPASCVNAPTPPAGRDDLGNLRRAFWTAARIAAVGTDIPDKDRWVELVVANMLEAVRGCGLVERAEQAERERGEAVERVRDLCAQMRSHPDTRKWADRIDHALDRPGEEST